MTIKIEVEASNIDELADKLLALGGRLLGTPATSPAGNGISAGATEPVKKAPRKVIERAPVATAAPSAEKTTEPTAAVSEETTTGGTTISTASADAEAPAKLDWDKDVAPVVTGFVKSHGREFVANVLEQFGVDRASQLPEGRWGELLIALSDAADTAAA